MNVIPTFPLKNLHDAVLAYAAFSGKLAGWFGWMLCPDFKDKLWSQLGFIVGCSKSRWSPLRSAFGNFIVNIVRIRSEKKVLWINARRIVAFVKHMKLFRYFSFVDQPRKPVSEHPRRKPSAEIELAVSKVRFAGSPIPAIVSLDNFSPKSFLNGFRAPHISKILYRVKFSFGSSSFIHGVSVDTNSRSVNTNG